MSANVPVALFDALATGVALLDRDLTVRYANARWREWLGRPLEHTSVFALLGDHAPNVENELRGLLEDGESRSLSTVIQPALGDALAWRLTTVAHRIDDGILLEAVADPDDVDATMHDIARRLAEVSDMAEVLRELCDIATRQCRGSGAAVLRMIGRQGQVVAAAGDLEIASGRSFELEGSMLQEAMRGLEIIHESNYSESDRPLLRVVPDLALGPIIVAPLQAHGEVLGVLAVARAVGDGAFRAADVQALRLLADHAALAVHKSLLLMQAQSADRAKGRFLATMSHELRTPLTALAGYGELLADQVIGPMSEPQLDILERMRSVTIHLSAMIRGKSWRSRAWKRGARLSGLRSSSWRTS